MNLVDMLEATQKCLKVMGYDCMVVNQQKLMVWNHEGRKIYTDLYINIVSPEDYRIRLHNGTNEAETSEFYNKKRFPVMLQHVDELLRSFPTVLT